MVSVVADTEGERLKVTNPLSSILLTLAPNVRPAVPKEARQVIILEAVPAAAADTV